MTVEAQKARRCGSVTDIGYTLTRLFGKQSFRGCQEEIINAAIEGNDILVILPTGHGKSLTYQLPAVAVGHGCTLVISPLLSLMYNQVVALQQMGVNAITLNGDTSMATRRRIWTDLECGHPQIRLLYVSPELCATDSFRGVIDRLIQHNELNRIVIDEAHCCVEWGHSFRKSYAQLGYFKDKYRHIPISAITATAPDQSKAEIIRILKLPNQPKLKTFTASVNRPNLHYEVRFMHGEEVIKDIVSFLTTYKKRLRKLGSKTFGAGIVYCRRRYTTQALAHILQAHGIGAQAFHAQLSSKEKSTIMQKWIDNEPDFQVIVATIAFGMGVDKPDVRFVLHYDLPSNIESYYQGSGRAGRDNKSARCILYYSREDSVMLKELRKDTSSPLGLEKLLQYCESSNRCRHLIIAEYFENGVPVEPDERWCNYACDYCKDEDDLKNRIKSLTQIEQHELC
jgi:RecQ family ATP-dependent DNA helicase